MLAFGVGMMVCLQALINIAVATVSVPTKGLSLPLVSAGGSGLVITCAALGLLRSACRFDHAADEKKSADRPPGESPAEDQPIERLWPWLGSAGPAAS
jgi:cell division protein FtsW